MTPYYGKDNRTEKQKNEIIEQWIRKDRRSCNITFEMKSGRVLRCDSFILYKFSKKYSEPYNPVHRIIRLEDLDGYYVENVIAWMYGVKLKVTPENAWNLLKTAFHFQISDLEKYLTGKLANIDSILVVLNMASKEMIQEKPQNAFRPNSTFWQLKVYNRAFHAVLSVFYMMEPGFGMNEIRKLNVTSIYALMYDLNDLKLKVRIVFLTIDWITSHRPSLQTIYGILGSLRINTSFDLIYGIKWHMHMFLTKYYSSPTEFFIWMDGSSEFVLASNKDILAIPPAMLAYPIDDKLPFSVTNPPRKPKSVYQFREFHKLGDKLGREKICGRYEPRGDIEQTYSFGEEHNSGVNWRMKLLGMLGSDNPASGSPQKRKGNVNTNYATASFIPCAGVGSFGNTPFWSPMEGENELKVKIKREEFKDSFSDQAGPSTDRNSSKSLSSSSSRKNGKGSKHVRSAHLYY